MPGDSFSNTRRRRVSTAPTYKSIPGDEEDGTSAQSNAVRSPAQAIPLGRSYVAHAGPTPSTWKASQSWTHDSDDIREGEYAVPLPGLQIDIGHRQRTTGQPIAHRNGQCEATIRLLAIGQANLAFPGGLRHFAYTSATSRLAQQPRAHALSSFDSSIITRGGRATNEVEREKGGFRTGTEGRQRRLFTWLRYAQREC